MNLSRRTAVAGGAVIASAAIPNRRAAARGGRRRGGVLTDLSGQYLDNSGPTSLLAAKQSVETFNPASHGYGELTQPPSRPSPAARS
jgi:hypothetical protein